MQVFKKVMGVLTIGLMSAHVHSEYLISVIQHPEADFFVEIVSKAYSEIGVAVSYVDMPSERRFKSLAEGLIDADLVARGDVTQAYPMIEVVEPPLATVELYLLCSNDIPCEPACLSNPENTIHTTYSTVNQVTELFNQEMQANVVTIENFHQLKALFESGKVDRIIYPSQRGGQSDLAQQDYQRVALLEIKVHHVIHKKHKGIKDRLSRALTNQLVLKRSGILNKE